MLCGIATPTVRKYAQALEGAGFIFERTNGGKDRVFTDSNIDLFMQFKKLSDESNMSVSKIAELLCRQGDMESHHIVSTELQTSETALQLDSQKIMVDTLLQLAATNELREQRLLDTIERLADKLDEVTELYRAEKKKKKRWFF